MAEGAGLRASALLTDMNQVLGWSAGNALEVAEALAFLKGERREKRLLDATLALAAEMLVLAGRQPDAASARALAQARLDDGSAAEAWERMIAALGGPADLLDRPDAYLPRAPVVRAAPAPREGVVTAMDVRALGLAVVELGGGRRRADDLIDAAVGLDAMVPLGRRVARGEPLCVIHGRDEAACQRAGQAVAAAVTIGEATPRDEPTVMERIGYPAVPA